MTIETRGIDAPSAKIDPAPPPLGILTFLITMLSMATVGLLVPLGGQISAQIGLTKAQFGSSLALFSLPSAILSMVVGSVCDRIGARRLLPLGGCIAIATDILLAFTTSAAMFRLALLATGVGFAALVVGSPALIIANLAGKRRTAALSLWSTYAPVGVAVGFLLSAPFAGTADWRHALYLHIVLLAVATIATAGLMRGRTLSAQPVRRTSIADMISVLRHATVARLGIALAIPSGISYGTSLIAPSYITAVTHVSIASSAVLVAIAKIAVVISGGLFAGWLVSRETGAKRLFGTLIVIGIVGQVALFFPRSGLALSLVGLAVWLFAYAGIAAMIFSTLPIVFDRKQEMGAANGLISQLSSVLSFLAPIIYFWTVPWTFFPILCAVGVLVALAMFPSFAGDTPAPARR